MNEVGTGVARWDLGVRGNCFGCSFFQKAESRIGIAWAVQTWHLFGG